MRRSSATIGIDTTTSPGATPAVSGPSSSTSTANSWPITMSRSGSKPNSDMGSPGRLAATSRDREAMRWACLRVCRSEPQMPQARVRTSTCPGPGTGSATSSTSSRPPRMTAAFTSAALTLGVVLLDRLHDGRSRRAGELLAVGGGPVARLHQRAGRVLERGHHVLGDELVGPPGGLGVGPLVRHQQVGAEATGLVDETLELDGGLLGR